MPLSIEQKKRLLDNFDYTLTVAGRRYRGQRKGWANDHRGLGAVVVFPTGHRSFYVVNERTMRPENVGIPPRPRRPRLLPSFRLRLK